MENKKRIVVTGLGVASCFGSDVEKFYQSLLDGKSGAKQITSFDCSEYPTRIGAPVQEFETDGYLDKKQARRVDPYIAYGIVSGKQALEHAGFDLGKLDELDKTRCGIIVGSGMGGMSAYTSGILTVSQKGFKRLTPFFVPYIITNMAGAMLAIELGFQGPNYSVSTACATATHSISLAANHIRNGDVDLMICGGAEAAINETALSGFVACKAVSKRNEDPERASRPWDKDRDGFLLGEGSGVLVLESLEHAQKRGATILAEYLGGAMTCDANHMTDPVSDGSVVSRTIDLALKDGQVEKNRVNYINAHATSTSVGDMCEIRAVKKSFGDLASNIYMNATKSMTGHALGAAGGLEAVATIMAMQTSKLHPTINLVNPEEEMQGLKPVLLEPVDCEIDVAVSNSFGFGGHNASLVFGKYKKS